MPIRRVGAPSPRAVYILMLRPLGLGDIMMLSPFILEVGRRAQNIPTYLVTEYPPFLDLGGVGWMKPADLTPADCRSGLVLSPTLSWRHARYLRWAGWYLGYFLSDRAMGNFAREPASYDARRGHYFDRGERLLTLLEPWLPGTTLTTYAGIPTAPLGGIALPERFACVAPFTNWAERQYPPDLLAAVIDGLAQRCPVVMVGGRHPDELEMAAQLACRGALNLVGKTSVQQAGAIIARAQVFVGNDSGLAHAAFLAGTPSVVVFGCVGGHQRIPRDPVLAQKVTALGAGERCPHFPCYDGFNRPHCRNPDRYACLRGVPPQTVVARACARLQGS